MPPFLQFVQVILEVGTFQRGGVFALDNCTIHIKGDNIGIQETLFEYFGTLVITLPPIVQISVPQSFFSSASNYN